MTDTTSTNIPTDHSPLITETETTSTSFASLNIHRHDSQIEINNYYINSVDDLSVQSQFKTLEKNSIIEENSCQLEVSELLEEVIKF